MKKTLPKYEYMKKKTPKKFSKQRGMIADNTKSSQMPTWIETDSEEEGECDIAEEAHFCLVGDDTFKTERITCLSLFFKKV